MLNYVDRQVEAYGYYERRQNKCFTDMLFTEKCGVFIDVGAHWGYYSLLLAMDRRFRDLKIHSFEPDEINRSQFFSNIFLNRLADKIKVYHEGVSNENRVTRFDVHQDENRGRSCISEHGKTEIAVCRVDDILHYKGQVIGIKIDVEGHELQALEGMCEILRNNKCILQVESFQESARKIEDFLGSLQYKLVNKIDNDHYYLRQV
jgi:FkbM family methyltransferase